ncbi:MAG: SDR family oxidoreductase [Gemmatimonadaceae bacterium]
MSVPNLFSVEGKRALVTGGARGIGAATARLLAECGADVAIGYRTRKVEADGVVSDVKAFGRRAMAVAGDLGEPGVADGLVERVVNEWGGLDILVHSAGIWPAEDVPVHEMTDARWRRTMRENLNAMFFVSRAAARVLGDGGRIVHISSTAGQRGEAGHADYAASKGAMISFVKSQAVELARRGITVNCVAPGWVETEMAAGALAADREGTIAAGIPVGRVASARDIAVAVVALCAPGARHIVGEIVNVNGGSVLPG